MVKHALLASLVALLTFSTVVQSQGFDSKAFEKQELQKAAALPKDFNWGSLSHMKQAYFMCGTLGFPTSECKQVLRDCHTKRQFLKCKNGKCKTRC